LKIPWRYLLVFAAGAIVHERDVNAARKLQRRDLAKAEVTRGDMGPLLADVKCVGKRRGCSANLNGTHRCAYI
jgi:hypothetical protein